MAGSLTVLALPPAAAAPGPPAPARPGEGRLSRQLGLQQVPKTDRITRKSAGAAQTNPMASLLPDPSQSNLYGWKQRITAQSKTRTARVEHRRLAAAKVVTPLVVDELEPDELRGSNDTAATAQRITRFGSARGKRAAARILGTLAAAPAPVARAANKEDDGSIRLAKNVTLPAGGQVRTTGTIGDGPHGSKGDKTGDFDFYALRGLRAGAVLSVDLTTSGSDDPEDAFDTLLLVWDARGELVGFNDDEGEDSLDSYLTFPVPVAGDYFVSVVGLPSLPEDPFDSGSGEGVGTEGRYTATFGLDAGDIDYYAVTLRAGDVLSSSAAGAATRIAFYDPARQEVFGSTQDASSIYPATSPLAGGGNAVADHVAATSGRYYVATTGRGGNYDVTLEVYRPGTEAKKATQTIFLDFNGARVNTAMYGGPGVRQLSPLSAFLGRWGLPASQQSALIDRIVATVTENLKRDFAGTGVKVKILNSRDHADPFGKRNVSRLIVGGTVAESGVETIGIAQSIDPGNFDTEETALILLDLVSEPAGVPYSLNTYLKPTSNRTKFLGTALGNIASHEAGHYLGNWHVDQFNTVLNLMDQGGNFPLLYGVGRDKVGGTADDPDVDFGPDVLNPGEGFTGIEDTRVRTGWALFQLIQPARP
ncbi:hypothetical protein ACFFOM_19070 [Microlunatus capsulatus]|uniref:Peptidase C-terminal archaeal/bacterial domain-containing protein n=1 Tax=Microlunatus capsulatus TaxID=99117 RepID=A0ABS4ZDU3_9ACTN|nr:hypothetical protein [Microlunatus capsulatus]MBP2418887.1 hypothetical protein [Microlunatus capsulatus]